MTSILPILFVLSATDVPAGVQPVTESPSQGRTIEIVIAGPEQGRSKMEETIRPLLGNATDLRWSAKERLPAEEALPAVRSDTGAQTWQIWIDLGNPVQLRIYLPAQAAGGATTIRTVERPVGEDADLVVRETVAQIVRAAVQGLRGDAAGQESVAAQASPESPADTSLPPPTPSSTTPAASAAARPVSGTQQPQGARRFGVVLSGGAHTSPLKLGEPAGEKNWLGQAMVGQVRWLQGKVLLAFRMSFEDSDRKATAYYLKSTYLTGTVAVSRFVDTGIVSFGIGLEAGVLVLHQNTWINYDWAVQYGYPSTSSLPGQTGKTNATGGLFGPVAELNLAATPNLFVHFDLGIPIAVLQTKDEMGSQWEASPYFRATVGVGLRL